jgi:predicted nucleic-acid-binding protein
VRIAPDTNLLVRVIVGDDSQQTETARRCISEADTIFLTLPVLCETAWVLTKVYGVSRQDLDRAIRALIGAANTVFDETAVSVGLNLLNAGGDFADGVIAAAGIGMGAQTFVSFDQDAVRRLTAAGLTARVPT